MNASATADVHLVQMWVLPDTEGIEPGYEQRDLNDALAGGGLVVVASGQGHEGAVSIHQRDAALSVGRLGAGETVVVPDAPHVHVFVAVGDALARRPHARDRRRRPTHRRRAARAHRRRRRRRGAGLGDLVSVVAVDWSGREARRRPVPLDRRGARRRAAPPRGRSHP